MLNNNNRSVEQTRRRIEWRYDDAEPRLRSVLTGAPGPTSSSPDRGSTCTEASPGSSLANAARSTSQCTSTSTRVPAPQGRDQHLFRTLLLQRRRGPQNITSLDTLDLLGKHEGEVHRKHLVGKSRRPAAEGRRGPGGIDAPGAPRRRPRLPPRLFKRRSRERAPGLAVPDGRAGCRVADLDQRRGELR